LDYIIKTNLQEIGRNTGSVVVWLRLGTRD